MLSYQSARHATTSRSNIVTPVKSKYWSSEHELYAAGRPSARCVHFARPRRRCIMPGPHETVATFRRVDVRVLDASPRDLRHLELPISNAGPARRIATLAQLSTAV